MPITPSKLKVLTKALTFDYLGETVNISYYPSGFNEGAMKAVYAAYDALSAAMDANDETAITAASREIATWMCGVLASWDYLQEDGTPQPITPDNLMAQMQAFPDFLKVISQHIGQDRDLGNANGALSSKPSAATSSRTAS